MAAKNKAAKAQKAALKARYNPYVQRVIDDDDLRDNLVEAYESARDAINRLSNGKSPTKQIFDDKKLQKDLKAATESIREVAVALHEAPRKQRSGGLGRVLVVGIVGAGLALALSEGLRKKVLDALFGAEEEFEYTSTTSSSSGSSAGSGSTGSSESSASTGASESSGSAGAASGQTSTPTTST
jgi:uncharacterized membrane protein YgcG